MLRMDDCEFSYFVNYTKRSIHLLECKSRFSKLTNIICPEFQKKLINQEGLLEDVIDFDWFIYVGDGITYLYKDYNFQFISNPKYQLHRPFIEIQNKGWEL